MGFISTSHGFARIHADRTIRKKISDLSALIKFGDAEESQGCRELVEARLSSHERIRIQLIFLPPRDYQS